MMFKSLSIFLLIMVTSVPVFANQSQRKVYAEKDYQIHWCNANNGKTEVILDDKARVDCLTNVCAIEFDFAKKRAESIGQALYYAAKTNKIPGVVLILEDLQKDEKYLTRLLTIAKSHNITVWTITPEDFKKSNYCKN